MDPKTVDLGQEQIGLGATSRVFKGKLRRDSGCITEVACKEYMVAITMKHKLKLLKELRCLKGLQHPNILHHFGIDFTRSLLVTELLEKEIEIQGESVKIHNARELLDYQELQPVPWSIRLHIMHGATSGLEFLHNHKIVHCDLKAANIFIGDDGEGKLIVKLGDFGTARFDFEQFSVSVLLSQTTNNREFKQIATASLTTATGSKIIHLRVIAHVSRSHPAVAGNPSTPVGRFWRSLWYVDLCRFFLRFIQTLEQF